MSSSRSQLNFAFSFVSCLLSRVGDYQSQLFVSPLTFIFLSLAFVISFTNDVNNESQNPQWTSKNTHNRRAVLTLVFHFLAHNSSVSVLTRTDRTTLRSSESLKLSLNFSSLFFCMVSTLKLVVRDVDTLTKHQKPQTFVGSGEFSVLCREAQNNTIFFSFRKNEDKKKKHFWCVNLSSLLSHSLTSNVISFLCVSCAFGIILSLLRFGLWRFSFFFHSRLVPYLLNFCFFRMFQQLIFSPPFPSCSLWSMLCVTSTSSYRIKHTLLDSVTL